MPDYVQDLSDNSSFTTDEDKYKDDKENFLLIWDFIAASKGDSEDKIAGLVKKMAKMVLDKINPKSDIEDNAAAKK